MTPRIVLVTDPSFGDEVIERCVAAAGAALPEGWLCVQLRDKVRTRTGLRLFAARLRRTTHAVGARLVVNGDAVVARDSGADGVHLGRGAGTPSQARSVCGASAWVSIAVHDDDAVRRASNEAADAVLVSPVFASRPPSAPSLLKRGRGVDALRSARLVAAPRVAVYALGGVTEDNAPACIRAGADGVAVVRALLASADPGRTARTLHDALARRC